MKKTITSIFLSTLLLASCYEDKGNYDYTLDSMNEITSISFTPDIVESVQGKTIELQQPLNENDTKRRIVANVEQTLAKDYSNLNFFWNLTYKNEEGTFVTDTIETNGYLDIELPMGKDISYNVFLQVYDTSTTLSEYISFNIATRPIFKNSLFVLHGEAGNRKLGNIEVIGTNANIYTDAHGFIFPGENPHTNAEGLSYSTYFDLQYTNGSWRQKESNNLTVFSSNADATTYHPYGLNVKFQAQTLFKPANTSFVFSKNIQTGDPSNYTQYRIVLSKDGQVCIGNYVPALYKPGYGIELYGGNNLHQTDYRITAATITDTRYVMWDAKNNRFLYISKSETYLNNDNDIKDPNAVLNNPVLDANVDFNNLENSPVGMRAVYAYIQYRENYSEAKPYFIFKDESTGEFYRYELTPIQTNDDKDNKKEKGKEEKKAAFSISEKRLNNFAADALTETITYNSWFTTNYLFYAKGSTVYRYNVSNGDNTPLYTAPEGYTISVIKFRTEDNSNFSGDLGRYLSIGMNNGENGAIAEILLNTASDVDRNVPATFYDKDTEGKKFGNIKDLQFVQIYMYQPMQY